MKKILSVCNILLIALMLCLDISCEHESVNDNGPVVPQETKAGDIIISRIFSGDSPEISTRFFSITNTTDHPIDLGELRVVFSPEIMSRGTSRSIYELPDATLAGGVSLFCTNSYGMEPGWDESFMLMASMPVIKPSEEGLAIEEDSLWSGIPGSYISNSISLGLQKKEFIDIIDTTPEVTVGSAYLRDFDNKKHVDNGWLRMNWNDENDRTDIENGFSWNPIDIRPIEPAKDLPVREDTDISGNTPHKDSPNPSGGTTIYENVAMGYPDRLHSVAENTEHFIIEKNCYVLSYNNVTRIPNWVSWHLEREDMQSGSSSSFHEEEMLPEYWTKVDEGDYQHSRYGFSRGHMCPNGERNGYDPAQYQTYSMANMVPQVQSNNGGGWLDLEETLRGMCRAQNKEIYLVSGPWGKGGIGTGRQDIYESIHVDDKNIDIRIPAATWKVALIIPRGENDLARITNGEVTPEVIAIWMPNYDTECSTSDKFEKYQVSVDFIEEQTGLDFFSELPDEIENSLEKLNAELDINAFMPANQTVMQAAPELDNAA